MFGSPFEEIIFSLDKVTFASALQSLLISPVLEVNSV